jgi:hypothetical protein
MSVPKIASRLALSSSPPAPDCMAGPGAFPNRLPGLYQFISLLTNRSKLLLEIESKFLTYRVSALAIML